MKRYKLPLQNGHGGERYSTGSTVNTVVILVTGITRFTMVIIW